MSNLEITDINNEQIQVWVKDVTINCMGSLKVCNSGGCYALVEHGTYTVNLNGYEEERRINRIKLYNIFIALIHKFLNFEYKGYSYQYYQGNWCRKRIR